MTSAKKTNRISSKYSDKPIWTIRVDPDLKLIPNSTSVKIRFPGRPSVITVREKYGIYWRKYASPFMAIISKTPGWQQNETRINLTNKIRYLFVWQPVSFKA